MKIGEEEEEEATEVRGKRVRGDRGEKRGKRRGGTKVELESECTVLHKGKEGSLRCRREGKT